VSAPEEGGDVRTVHIIVERHSDGYLGYPLGIRGAVVGQGETLEAAVAGTASAVRFHLATFGEGMWDPEATPLAVFVDEVRLPEP